MNDQERSLIRDEMEKDARKAAETIVTALLGLGERFFPNAIVKDKKDLEGYRHLLIGTIILTFSAMEVSSQQAANFPPNFFIDALGEAFSEIVEIALKEAELSKLIKKEP